MATYLRKHALIGCVFSWKKTFETPSVFQRLVFHSGLIGKVANMKILVWQFRIECVNFANVLIIPGRKSLYDDTVKESQYTAKQGVCQYDQCSKVKTNALEEFENDRKNAPGSRQTWFIDKSSR